MLSVAGPICASVLNPRPAAATLLGAAASAVAVPEAAVPEAAAPGDDDMELRAGTGGASGAGSGTVEPWGAPASEVAGGALQDRQRRIVAGGSHCRFVALAYPYLVGIAEATFSQHQMQRVFFGIDWLMQFFEFALGLAWRKSCRGSAARPR